MAFVLAEDPALAAYEGLAPFYDHFTAGYAHERWLDALECLAFEHGLRGRRLLDVACGTGKSFMPMLARGYEVTACDLSPAMVDVAREKVGDEVDVFVADMRELPPVGEFDLVTCLDDAVNYLLSEEEMRSAIAAMGRNLAPGGLLVFDVNTLATYRRAFAGDSAAETGGAFFCWRGQAPPRVEPGLDASAWVEVFRERDDGLWERTRSRHEQRHHPRESIEDAIAAAGLELAAVRGQLPGARLEPELDEERHTKAVFLARRPDDGEEVESVVISP
jgi:SAM-dependent methyltransferase